MMTIWVDMVGQSDGSCLMWIFSVASELQVGILAFADTVIILGYCISFVWGLQNWQK